MKKAMKLVSLVLAVVMLLGCLTACGSKSATTDTPASTDASNTSSDGGEIVIALISNTTGDYAQYGQPVRDGAQLLHILRRAVLSEQEHRPALDRVARLDE